ncbi:MAG: urea ABC transporter permease subunit UrtB, partial [Gemmatimonadaceae bacterium]|nr:urea ABC transporter permease subunit UrtB [Acetobacteraceae bacterium]
MRLIALLLILLAAAPALAQPNLAPLAGPSFDDIRRGVEELAVSGDPRAAPVLGALQAGRLLVG